MFSSHYFRHCHRVAILDTSTRPGLIGFGAWLMFQTLKWTLWLTAFCVGLVLVCYGGAGWLLYRAGKWAWELRQSRKATQADPLNAETVTIPVVTTDPETVTIPTVPDPVRTYPIPAHVRPAR